MYTYIQSIPPNIAYVTDQIHPSHLSLVNPMNLTTPPNLLFYAFAYVLDHARQYLPQCPPNPPPIHTPTILHRKWYLYILYINLTTRLLWYLVHLIILTYPHVCYQVRIQPCTSYHTIPFHTHQYLMRVTSYPLPSIPSTYHTIPSHQCLSLKIYSSYNIPTSPTP